MNEFEVKGFQFAGVAAGIKQTEKTDLALIYSEKPAQVVGAFTTNKVKAAPVQVSQKNIRSGLCSAIISNSGNANACTGEQGLRDAQLMVKETARLLKVPVHQVLVCSTGKIGVPLPMERVVLGIPKVVAGLSSQNLNQAAEAILTTDLFSKISSAEGNLFGRPYRIAGFAKGAGMIEPHMAPHATMLAYIVTDAFLPKSVMKTLFNNCVEESFNRVTVDGDMSTNDTAFFLANGLAENKPFTLKTPECRKFADNLFNIMEKLAKDMVKDGEGATKCVRLVVKGARNDADARKIAYTIGNSPLVKTSFFGQDPNWGRILGAIGRAGVPINPDKIDVNYGPISVARRGLSTGPEKEAQAKEIMKQPEFDVTIDCHLGKGSHYIFASDLTLDYIKLNSCYRT